MDMHKYQHPSGKLTVIWQPKKCIHSEICVKMLPQVYNPKERPWAKPENATPEEIRKQVSKCPSGALSIENNQDMNNIKHHEQDKKFEIFHEGTSAGLMTYTWAGNDKFIIDHTEVFPEFEGKGLAKKLVYAGAEYARKNGKIVIPLCPYAKITFQKNEDLQDVLA